MGAVYLSIDEYKTAPTAVDFGNLTGLNASTGLPSGPSAQDAELARVIARASSCIDTFVFGAFSGGLVASTSTETTRARVNRDGWFSIHPKRIPLVSLTAFAYGTSIAGLTSLTDLTGVWIQDQNFLVAPSGGTFTGPLLSLSSPRPSARFIARYSYVAGFTNTPITSTTTAGAATQFTVGDSSGLAVGSSAMVFDPVAEATEQVTVTALTATTVTVSSTAKAHDGTTTNPVLSTMPEDLKMCAVLYTSALIKSRGDAANILAGGLQQGEINPAGLDRTLLADIRQAQSFLRSYRRVR